MPIHYTDPHVDVPPGVDFLDVEQARAWVAACEIDKPWRDRMRQRFVDFAGALPSGAKVLELGSGPGYLAEAVLQNCRNLESYTLLDFSDYMLELSRERLMSFPGVRFVKADFKRTNWYQTVSPPYTAVLAMQSIHEIRHKRHVPAFYAQIRNLLEPDGLFAICDGTPHDANILWQAALFMTFDEQLDALESAGFKEVKLDGQIDAMILLTAQA